MARMVAPLQIGERAPQFLLAALLLAAGLQIARWVTLPATGTLPMAISAVSATPAVAATPTDLTAIAAAQLFGALVDTPTPAHGSADPNNAPPTSLPLVLTGVFARTDPAAGYAILGESAANARLHAAGTSLQGGVVLRAVYSDRVLLERAGTFETLALPRNSAAWANPAATTAAPISTDRARDLIARDPNAIAQVMRWQQMLADGATRGFRVYPGSNEKVFRALGLKPGDLLTAINQVPLDGPARGEEIMSTLASSGRVNVTLNREGREQNLALDLEQAMRSVESNTRRPESIPEPE